MPQSTNLQTSSLRLLILSPTGHSDEDDNVVNKTISQGASNARFTSFLSSLTGIAPSSDLASFAGYTSHPPLNIHTKYYAAKINLWCDELPPLTASNTEPAEPSLTEWTSQMLSAEAQEVREVLGSIVVLSSFNAAHKDHKAELQDVMSYVTAVNKVREAIEDESGRDVATILAVQDMTPSATAERQLAQGQDTSLLSFTQKLEETCLEDHGIFGWDVVGWKSDKSVLPETAGSGVSAEKNGTDLSQSDIQSPEKRNEFGEKLGMARVLEVLEQVNWSVSDPALDQDLYMDNDYNLVSTDDFLDSDDDFSTPSFKPKINAYTKGSKDPIAAQSDEFQREIMGLHFALEEQSSQEPYTKDVAGDDIQVEQLSGLMERVVAIKEAASEMSKADREKFARREVGKIMREMDLDRS